MSVRKRNWETFFSPQSVAVVGASRTPGKIGHDVLYNIIKCGYKGKIYPVNPQTDSVLNLKSYKSVSAIPGKLDLVVFVIPALQVVTILEECGQRGVGSAVIISSGFKEVGKEGAALEQKVTEIAKKYNMNILGPNCLGLIDMGCSLNASFAAEIPGPGNIAFLSQSGALGTAILDWAIKEGIGFSKFLSLGNKADVNESDLINALCDDPNTKAILGYIEDVKDGRAFLKIAKKAAMKKPVIITKSGSTAAGAKAASSHTGSLAGADHAFEAAFKQTGVIRANRVEELFDYALSFSYQPYPKGPNMAVITNAGGPGIMAADIIEKLPNIQMAKLQKTTVEALREALPPAAAVNNPVDVMGDASDKRYKEALDIVLHDKNVHGVMVILTPQSSSKIPETAEAVIEENTKENGQRKPIFTAFLGGHMVEKGIKKLSEHNVPNYPFPERAAGAFDAMVRYANWRKSSKGKYISYNVQKEKVEKILSSIKTADKIDLPEHLSREIAENYGFRFPKSILAKTSQDAVKTASQIGFPVVMKIASEQISHKSDVGGVKVGLASKEEVKQAFDEIMKTVKKAKPKAKIDGVLIQEMITQGQEVIIGLANDPQFGPMIMFGLGGIYVEIMKDVTFRIAPLTDKDAESMIKEIKAYPMIKGVRGHEGFDEEACKDAILRLSQLVTDFPQIQEMDINPLKLFPKTKGGAVAIDVRMSVSNAKCEV